MWAKLNFATVLLIVGLISYLAVPRKQSPRLHPAPHIVDDIGGMDSFIQRLDGGPDGSGYIANYSFPSDHYRTGWVRRNAAYTDAGLRLSIDRTPTQHQPFSGAEYHRKGKYGYGRYEVIMKAARGDGLVSAFFVYTGPHYGDPHSEIDLEFLGRDTTVLHPNLYVGGEPLSPPQLELGFDAADRFNLYAFDWAPGQVTWFVNGEQVLDISRPVAEMPAFPGIVMANIWTGSPAQYAWHGKPDFEDGSHALFRCISFQARGDDTLQCSDLPAPATGDMDGRTVTD